ncbi:MAG TPA: hypothetical protein VFR59_00595 [Steroidobacteraceae bacterium]|nr:hypothetical protein [Steroidobacteraceae bacterium]
MARSRRTTDLPAPVVSAIAGVLGPAVGAVKLVERSWRVRWHPRMHATTRRNVIYLRGTIEEFASDPALVLHEYFHVMEQWAPGKLTRTRYLLELLRRGYQDNQFEVETREFVTRNIGRFRRLLDGR